MRIIITLCILATAISFAFPFSAVAQQPETIEEAKGLGLQFLEEIPKAMKKVWEEQALPVFLGMWNWTKDMWNNHIFPWLHNLWVKFLGIFGKEIEQRRPFIEQEFEQEKEQLKQEIKEKIPEAKKTLWEHIKSFFLNNEQE